MFTKNTLKSTLGLIVTSFILSACGGGEGGGDNTPPARNTGSISGNVFDAPVSGAKIEVFEYKDGNLGRKLASTTSDAFGDYKVEFESSSMPLFIVAKEGSYTDPLTKNTVSVSNGKTLRLEAMLNYKEGRDQSLMLTPLTNIVSGLTQYKVGRGVSDSTAISESLNSINDMYGFDVNETTPIDITKGGQSSFATSGHQYGALLTAYSSYSYDLIQTYGDTQSNIYTSMHLADIQYRDVIADGLLDGLEISSVSGGVTPLTFGQQKVSSEVYTNDLAQHVLIVVNDPNLNISGTDADDYVEFSRKINDQGTNSGTGGVIPPRDETEIDTEAPTVSRTDSDVLAGLDKVDIKINDEIGVQGVSAYLEYQLDGVWSLEGQCDDEQTSDSEFCFLEFNGFESGLRETSIKVSVDTKAIDAVEVDSDTELSNVTAARLVFYTTDVLGNELIQGRDVGHYVDFEWDNNAPVIEVTSEETFNGKDDYYFLRGIIKEDYQNIESTTVRINGELPKNLECKPMNAEFGSACSFEESYPAADFSSSTTSFEITATDTQGNVGIEPHTVTKDDQEPAQDITYPEGTSMAFVNVDVDGERTTYEGAYTQSTYTSESVQSSRDYLKIDFMYASTGLQGSLSGVEFDDFKVNLLKENNIPYVRVRVSDISSESALGSSADKLTLSVKYYVSQNNDGTYAFQKTTETKASTDKYLAKIPHEEILNSSGHVSEIIYYVPFVKEILGESFKSVSENAGQKLVIQTIDESNNKSAVQEVYFRSSFDLPTMTVITPFIGARVQLEGLGSSGEFTSLANCTTIQQLEIDNSPALDVASCEATTDLVNYDFMRVRLIGIDGNTQPHYYKWKSDPGSQSEQVNLNSANIGAYFKLNGSKTFYITELATYQTGLFDSQWNQVEAGNKTPENAARILDDVQNALAGGSDSFFGFDPTIVSYATNEMLKGAIPEKLPNNYIHRFLVEAIYDITQVNNMLLSNSVDFASAIYDDLQYDGQANGIGSGGKKIVLDSYEFSSKSYRNDLAQSYYNIMTEKYGVAANLAQRYADQISMANPSLDGEQIIDGDVESIDKSPPQPSLSIENGRETWVGNKRYVAGVLNSQILLEDPSGIVVEEGSQPSFVTMWYEKTEPNTGTPIDLNIRESGGDSYKKEYLFTLNTESSNLTGIDKFELITSAMDEHGNSYGYNGDDPHIETLYIDNDYPLVTYTPPIGGDDNPVEEGVYLNTNYDQELTFTIEDPVGDKLDKRGLTFYNAGTGVTNSYDSNDFSSNTEKQFKVKLCSGDKCLEGGDIISPEDGDWTVYVNAEDNLSNIVNRQTTNAPQFSVLLDSKGPVVNGSKIANHLGGNSSWVPDITWSLSPGSLVKVEMKPESGRRFTLQQYETEPEESTEPYLFGIQPNVEVRLVADAFKYNEKNFFYVTATDSSSPSGTHSGEFEFLVDNKGPVIELADPWVIDTNSGESYVLGNNFTVKLTSVSDDSDVSKVELWQQDQVAAIRSIDPKDPTQPFDIVITETQSDAIVIGEDKKANLYLKAIDEYGFESKTEIRTILLDREGPSLKLNGFDPESFYLGNYVFNLSAQDLNDRGTPSSEGVNKETLEYWTFKENPSDASTLVGDEMKIPLAGENDGNSAIRTIRLGGSDIRGNTTIVDYAVKVQNSMPTIKSVVFTYEDGTPVSSGGQIQITRNEPVIISIDAEDESGVPLVEGTYKYGEQTNSISFSQKDGLWEARLTEADLTEDGAYQLEFKVYNNVRYNSEQERPSETRSESINVQRQGVALSIAKPTDFQSHISGSTLNVEFGPAGDVKAKTLECWVRENYTSDGVPEDGSNNAYSGVITNPQENYKCSITTDVNMSVSPVVLITKTVGTNDTETVNKFSFNMMDIDVPTVEQDTYQFTGNDVGLNDKGEKILSLTLSFKDNLSGVDISDGNEPLLIRNRLNMSFEPNSCSSKLGITTCSYTGLYTDILSPGALQHLYTIKNLSDIAGNLGSDHALELLLPARGDLEIAITSPVKDTIVRGETLEMNFKVKVGQNSDLENIVVTLDDASYNLNDNPENFGPFIKCEDDYSCSTFTAPLDDKLDGQIITPKIQIIDVWGESKSDEVSVMVDNSKPNIDDSVSLKESPDDVNLVRFQFSVWDEGSGIAKVKYTIVNPKYIFDKDDVGDSSHLYFDLPKTELEELNSIRVNVEATDNVGWTQNKTIDIDIRIPTIDLAFDGITSLQGGKLAFTNDSQAFTITSDEGEDVKAASYTIDLVPVSGSTIKFSGKIASSTASDTMTFDIDAQAEYMQKVTVTDSIGRVITDVNVLNKTYDAEGIASIVDYQAPVISSITSSQDSMIPEVGQYYLDVRAYVFDKNLSSVNSTADNGTDAPVNPQSIEEPPKDGDPYLIRYLLSPGDYLINVTADDLVEHQTEKSLNAKVEAASIPELTISTTASMPLAGGVEIPISFTFTEEVNKFEFSDVEIKADDDNDIGELKQASWITTDNITWTVNYITPEKQDKNITIRVGDNSYESVNTIPGTGDSLVMGVEGVLPTLSNATFDPLHQGIGKIVKVILEFDKELQEATAMLGENEVSSLTVTADKKVWEGNVQVPDTNELAVGLIVSQYKDLVGNVGAQDSTYSLPITPTLDITPVGSVDGSNAADLAFLGTSTRFDGQGLSLEVKAQGSDAVLKSGNATVASGGAWSSSTVDISDQPNGSYTVVVTGTNASGVEVTQSASFTVAQAVPTLTSATFNPPHQAMGQSVSVSLKFDKALQAASAELGGKAIPLTQSADASVWTGDVSVAMSSDLTVGLVVKDYQDSSGNVGVQDSTHSLPITPTLDITPVGSVDGSNAANLAFSGISTRFDGQGLSLEVKAQGSETVLKSGNATVASGGAWSSSSVDISDQPNGAYTVIVTGTNASGVEVMQSASFTVAQAVPTLTSATFNPPHQAMGQSVSVSLKFDKALQAASAELGGKAIPLTQSADASVWTGDVLVATSSDLTVDLVVKDYQDLSGNVGVQDSTYSLPITPTLDITPVGSVDGSNAADLAFSGTSTRFDGQGLSLEVKAQGSDAVLKSGNATVASGGAWSSSTVDISDQPNGSYTVVVTGTNASGVDVTQSASFTVAQAVPTLTSVTFNPTHQAIGQSVSVSLKFDKALQAASAELGGKDIPLTKSVDASVWTGDVLVATSSDLNVDLVVKDYQDLSGNVGVQDSTYSLPITPTLDITPVGSVDGSNAAVLAFSGTSTRFDGQGLSLEVKAQGSDAVLKSGNATVASGGAWSSSTVDISDQPNGSYTVVVTGTNASGVEVTQSASFTVAQAVPTLTSATFNPPHQVIGQSVSVSLQFDKAVQAASAELGGKAIPLTQSVDASVWTGDVLVATSSDLTVGLVVKDYQDLSGNVGVQDSTYSLPITPTLDITPVGSVDGSNAADLAFSGTSTRFDGQGLSLEVKAQGSDAVLKSGNATVASGGAWSSSTVDISDQPNGSYTVVVTGTNASGVEVTQSASFTVAQAVPTLTSATFNPPHQVIGQSVSVSLQFDKAVQAASAELGGKAIPLTQSVDASVWTGDVLVATSSDLTVGLVVKDYQDLSGNVGVQDSTYSLPITPTLDITPVGSVDGSNAAVLAFSGTSTRFDGQGLSLEVKAQGSDAVLKSGNATVASGGAWSSSTVDISDQPNGSYTVVVTGTNASGVEVTQSASFTVAQAVPTLTSATFNPPHQVIGQSVSVSLQFDKAVQAASAELGGKAIPLTQSVDASVWTGDVLVATSSDLTVGLVVKDYQDLSGNVGVQDSTYSLPITPTLDITPVGSVDGSNAAVLAFSGTSTRFDGQGLSLEVKAQGSDAVLKSGNATVASGGAWSSSTVDISDQPNGSYTVVVTGTNASGVEVTQSASFTVAQAVPTLTSATFNPPHQVIGQSVSVSLQFDKAVQAASAELGGKAIPLTQSVDASVWTGDVLVATSSDLTVGLVVKDYQDLSGNVGVQDSTYSLPITPTLDITPVGSVDGSNAAVLAFSGTSTRFDGQGLSLEVKAQGSDAVLKSGNATVASGGAWSSSTVDISDQPNGSYTVVVTGTNASGVEVTQSASFTVAQAVPTLTSVTFNPTHQAIGQSVSVSLKFDKALQAASAELGGTVISLTKSVDASVWTGDVLVATSSDLTVGLVVKDYQDLSGNVGAQDSRHSMPITPTLDITPVGSVDGNNAANLVFSGTSTRFDGQGLSLEVKAQGSDAVLKNGNATVASGGAWSSSTVDISDQPNGSYTVVVTGTNASGVEVTQSASFTVAQAVPTLTSVTFNPTHQAIGQSVSVSLKFDKALQAASAELGGTVISLTKSVDASVWTGDVLVATSSDLTVGLVVKDYQDLSGNVGAQDSRHSMPITPTLDITPVGSVDGNNAANLVFSGTSTRFDGQGLSLEVKAQGSDAVLKNGNATVASGGAWSSSTVDISDQPNGSYTVVVTGTNASGVEVTQSASFTVAQAVPTLTSVTFNPTHQAIGQSVSVSLKFDKALQAASAELGGTVISLTKSVDASVWTGDVLVATSSDLTVGLVVKDYQDLSGNVGAQDSRHSMPITPTLDITPVGSVDGNNAANLVFSGTSTRFDGQGLSLEVKAQGSDAVLKNGNATVASGGAWSSSTVDISDQPNGSYTVVVTGTNASGVEVTQSASFTVAQAVPTLTSVTFNPTHQAIGQSVSVSLKFDKALQAASAELGGTVISLTKSVDASVWTGDVLVATSSDLTVGLVVKDYQDLSGNVGAQDSRHSMPITPTLDITPVGSVDGNNAANLVFSGTSTRFDGQGLSLEVKAQGSDAVLKNGNATVASGGAWSSSTVDISDQPNGSYTVVVTGTNASGVEVTQSASFTVAQAVPTLTSATFNPPHQTMGQSVSVSLKFDKELQAASAELGGKDIPLTQSADASVWTGDVSVATSSDLTVGLVVKDYQDLSGNVGAQDSTHSLPITPTISISAINSGNDVNESESPTLILDGTTVRFSEGDKLSLSVTDSGGVKVSDAEVLVGENGVWQYELTLDPIEGGSVTVSLHGANALGADAILVESTFTLNKDASAVVVVVPSLLRQLLIYDKGTKLAT
ncbi:tandem large repeat [Vibrio bathopelagicus]|uniref:tandem large repeat n=1 Tax=Vibrio bathopelagicus TaxID=2777577 RepID=UPI001864CEBD|nr:tandem large repeat [Vibrio bathopelagicus]